ncbi:MAG: thioredoxin family protein [Salinivirgaceae bacterium]|nr:thioredoxin family protein [Salinivirgaceae bacterium]
MRTYIKQIALVTLVLLLSIAAKAQLIEPVKWQKSCKQTSDSTYELKLTANIDKGWHIYAQSLPEGNYVLPTQFEFSVGNGVELIDSVIEVSKAIAEMDKIANVMTYYFSQTAVFVQQIKVSTKNPTATVTVNYQACNDELCTNGEKVFSIFQAEDISEQTTEKEIEAATTRSLSTLWKIILEAILWGFAALLTPCVFPMIPMTVSFFIRNSKSKSQSRLNASAYGLSIVALYTLPIAIIILATYFIGGQSITADIFNWISTHWLPNVLFFVIFMVFAASFLGAFEITLPSWLVNKADQNADKGGLLGVFFMAATLVLVSFSCTGPIVGTIIVESTRGDIWEPIITMIAFSVAFALPFTLFAFFPSWLNKLPKSGSWLNTIKVVLGFIELALGLKFLSVADQTYHWGILDREVYIALWIVIFSLLGLYLIGKIKLPNDDESIEKLSVGRLFTSIVTFAFVVYLIPGMWGAPLKALAGYLPPMSTMDFVQQTTLQSNGKTFDLCENPKYANILHLPHGLQGYFDYEQALNCARKQNKPLFVSFTGHGCVNCREMEARVWSDSRVLKTLTDNYIIVELYVDDKTELDEQDWKKSDYDGKMKTTIGKVNSDIQVSKFNINAQPYYCLLDADENLLAEPRGYNLNVDAFIEYLNSGITAYKNR